MANAIEICLKEIYIQIPIEILNLTFNPRQRMITLDQAIQDDVIIPKVLEDCNLVSGREAKIILRPEWVVASQLPSTYSVYTGDTYCIYRIPPEARENRPIAECTRVDYPGYMYSNANSIGSLPYGNSTGIGNSVGGIACTMMGAMNGAGVATPTPIRINGHMVKLTPFTFGIGANVDWILTCKLAFDKEFTNLTRKSIRSLAKLCVTATKAYIYTNLIVQIDQAYLEGGQELGIVKEIVSGYSDAYEEYQEQLYKFHGTSSVLDPEQLRHRLWLQL